jgi:hypothetical protein
MYDWNFHFFYTLHMPSSRAKHYRPRAIEYNPDLIRQHPTVITVEHSVELTLYIVRYRFRRHLRCLVIKLSIEVEQGAVVHAGLELQHRGSPHFPSHITTTVCIPSNQSSPRSSHQSFRSWPTLHSPISSSAP